MSYKAQYYLDDVNYTSYAGVGDLYEYQPDNEDDDVDLIEVVSSKSNTTNSNVNSDENIILSGMSPEERQRFEEEQNMILRQLQAKDQHEYDSDSDDDSIFSLISQYNNLKEQRTTIPSKPTISLSKFMHFNFKGKFLPRNSKHVRMLSEMKIPIPDANGPILFESKVQKWNSSISKKTSNNYLVLTKKCLCSFKSAERASKIFNDLSVCALPSNYDRSRPTDSVIITKLLPSENVILTLATVYAVSEQHNPESHIRIDYILGPKKHEYISINSQNLKTHRHWLTTIRSAVHVVNAVGPYLTLSQRLWLMEKLRNLDDLEDEDEDNFVSFRVLLESLTDQDLRRKCDKETKVPVIFVLGRNNIYLIPFNIIGNDLSSNGDIKKDFKIRNHSVNHPLLVESVKTKEIEFQKFQYPLLCLTNIESDGIDDSFQLTFNNTHWTFKRTLSIASHMIENIITEIRTAIDSITFWWPSPGYQLNVPPNIQATIIPENEGDKISQAIGFERMIEAQCHVNHVNKSRIAFNLEYVLGNDSISLGLGVDHLPFRFILLPPESSSSSQSKFKDRSEDYYSNQELMAIFNSLKYHPLLHEIILRNTNLFELQIQPGPKNHKSKNMLASILYDLLLSNPRLRKLDLTSCGIISETVSVIGEAFMTGQSCLERLLLGNNSITREGAKALASGITGHKSAIKELDISECKLTHDSIESILHALDTNDPSKLEVLDISYNDCDLESDILTEFLSKTLSLRTLNLRDSPSFFTHITPVISIETLGNTQLTTLNLGGVPLNNIKHLDSLYSYIQSPAFAKVQYLNVDHCNLDGEAVTMILSYVTTSPNYKKVRVWAGGNHVTKTLRGYKDFCNAIRNDWTPIWLSLKDTIFGSDLEVVVDILQAFCENTVIKHLDLSYPNFKSSNDGPFEPQTLKTAKLACGVIGSIFSENKSLKELNLCGNPDSRFGPFLGPILLGLEENDTLEKLNIKGNAIGDQGAKTLSEALRSNTKLKVLNCDDNEIGLEGYHAIHRVLTTGLNRTIQQFVYPAQDIDTYDENLEMMVQSRESIFTTAGIKTNPKIASEKKKTNFLRVIDEITRAVEENVESTELTEEDNFNYDTFKSTSTSS